MTTEGADPAPISAHFLTAVIFTCFIALTAGVVGTFGPGWLVHREGSATVNEGLWYAVICPQHGPCFTTSRLRACAVDTNASVSTPTTPLHWAEYRIEASIALLFAVAGCACSVIAAVKRKGCVVCVKRSLTVGCVAMTTSGVLLLIVVLKVGAVEQFAFHPAERWSLNTAGVGAGIAMFAAGFFSAAIRRIHLKQFHSDADRHSSGDTGRRHCGDQADGYSAGLSWSTEMAPEVFMVAKPPYQPQTWQQGQQSSSSATAASSVTHPPPYEEVDGRRGVGEQAEMEAPV